MGAWAMGPFDNDFALDELRDLAEAAGLAWDEQQSAYAGRPDTAFVVERLSAWMTEVLEQDSDDHASRAYMALGLVAIAVVDSNELPGTIAGEDQPFEYGEPYKPLLDRTHAAGLLSLAQRALDAVFDPSRDWYHLWSDTNGLDEWRAALARLLRAPMAEG